MSGKNTDAPDAHIYDDIIGLPHHQSATRPHMSAYDRAAQFSAFAALTGYDAAISETARLTEAKQVLSDDQAAELDAKLAFLRAHLAERPEITVRCFVADEKKAGGRYESRRGRLKRIDTAQRRLLFCDGGELAVDDVAAIEGDIFPAE